MAGRLLLLKHFCIECMYISSTSMAMCTQMAPSDYMYNFISISIWKLISYTPYTYIDSGMHWCWSVILLKVSRVISFFKSHACVADHLIKCTHHPYCCQYRAWSAVWCQFDWSAGRTNKRIKAFIYIPYSLLKHCIMSQIKALSKIM